MYSTLYTVGVFGGWHFLLVFLALSMRAACTGHGHGLAG
jgi:hypothetical protein